MNKISYTYVHTYMVHMYLETSAHFFSQSYILLLPSSNYMASAIFRSGCRLSRFYIIQPHGWYDFNALYAYMCCSCTPTNFGPPQRQPPTP